MQHHPAIAATIALLGATPALAQQWTTTVLHPPGSTSSAAFAVSETLAAGHVYTAGTARATVWGAVSPTINPVNAVESFAYAIDSSGAVGGVAAQGTPLIVSGATYWPAPASAFSAVDLTPPSAASAAVYGLAGDRKVGEVSLAGILRASLWDEVAPWLDLHPAAAQWSGAYACDDAQIVGAVAPSGVAHAALWISPTEPWIDLHPPGAFRSVANAVASGRQAGEVTRDNGERHAALWSGTAASYVDLNPSGSDHSIAWGAHATFQVGHARFNGLNHAILWNSSGSSFVDLHQFLPTRFAESYAFAIWTDADTTRVAGYAHNTLTGRDEAILWSRDSAPPNPADYLYNNWDGAPTAAPGSGFSPRATSASGVAAPASTLWREGSNDGAAPTPVFNTTAGFGMQQALTNRVADDFRVPLGATWEISRIHLYSYQTNATPVSSTFTGATIQIWDGPPGQAGSTVLWGDEITNRLIQTEFTGIYNIFASTGCPSSTPNTNRPIMRLICDAPITLPSGSYWLDIDAAGSLPSGPWAPMQIYSPTTRNRPSDNALRKLSGVWSPIEDPGSCAIPYPVGQDLPFELIGTPATCPSPPDLTSTALAGMPGYAVPDNRITTDDFFFFLILYTAHQNCSPTCPSPPDLTTTATPGLPGYGTPDGIVNMEDFFYYLTLFAAGC